MGKYGSGVGMKDMIEMEFDEIKSILHPYKLGKQDEEELLGIVKNLAYEWCCSNACARAVEEWAKDHMSEEMYKKYVCLLIPTHLDNYHDTYVKVMSETYPWYNDSPFDDEDEDE